LGGVTFKAVLARGADVMASAALEATAGQYAMVVLFGTAFLTFAGLEVTRIRVMLKVRGARAALVHGTGKAGRLYGRVASSECDCDYKATSSCGAA
jgi:hypothetical protein